MYAFFTLPFFSLALAAYLLGSVPWGAILTRRLAGIDIREQGSGNIGATNVWRIAGNRLGLMTLLADMAKGALPALLARLLLDGDGNMTGVQVSWIVCAAVIGHLFPVYSRFQGGGKGVATAAGGFLIVSPWACLVAIGLFAAGAALSKKVSAGSMIAAASLTPAVWYAGHSVGTALAALATAALVILRHHANIRRLLNGQEPDIRWLRNK